MQHKPKNCKAENVQALKISSVTESGPAFTISSSLFKAKGFLVVIVNL